MCFSSEASFVAGTLLLSIGIAAITKVRAKKELAFAAIPLIFGIQQLTEGFVWLSLTNNDFASFKNSSENIFVLFAQVVWPLWVPMSILFMEKEKRKRSILALISVMGLLVSLFRVYWLSAYGVQAHVVDHHIVYTYNFIARTAGIGPLLYFIATIIPPLISGVKKMWLIGVLNFASFLFSAMFFKESFLSVWCFFAALISLGIFIVMVSLRKRSPASPVVGG